MRYSLVAILAALGLVACTTANPGYVGDGVDLGGAGDDLAGSGGDDLATAGDDLGSDDLSGTPDQSTPPDLVGFDLAGADLKPPPGCTTVTDGKYHVDPKTGSDGLTTTGASGCPFRTVKAAISYVSSGRAPAQVLLENDITTATETFPIRLAAGITVTSGAAPHSVLPGAGQTGFQLVTANSAITGLTVDGSSSANVGIAVGNGSDVNSTKVSGITVTSFRYNGISVESGGINIGHAVTVTKCGLGISGTMVAPGGLEARGGSVAIDVPANSTATHFDGNINGIVIEGIAALTLSGVSSGNGTITASNNVGSNIVIRQFPINGTLPGAVAITGVVANNSQNTSGVRVFANSRLKLRSSVAVGNALSGVEVSPAPNSNVQITQGIDLGAGGDFGLNTLQTSAGGNKAAGLCVDDFNGASVTIEARGNIFSKLDCSGLVVLGSVSSAATCTGGVDVGGTGTNVTIRLANCPDL